MLDFIYWPVSAIMWVWYWLFSHVLPDSPGGSGIAWALSVVFLVFTLRAILYKPFVKQIRTTRKMQEIQPQMQAIRKKYGKDRVKMTEEMQKLQKEHGFNPLLGCLPMLAQIPVFIGLFHVLRSFNRMGTGFGQLGMTAEETRSYGNYIFNVDQVQNFLDARLFGVPLSSYIIQPTSEWVAFSADGSIDFTRLNIIILVIPLVIISSIATHMNSRASVARQSAAAMENPQTRIMNNLALYVFPLGILVSGAFFPVAILLYWVSNNLWTYVQQHVVFGNIEKEEEAEKAAKLEKRSNNAPKPGAKPAVSSKPKPGAKPAGKSKTDAAGDKDAAVNMSKDASTDDEVDLSKTSSNGATASGADKTKSGSPKGGTPKAGGSPGSNGAKKPASGRPASGPGGQRGGNQQRRKKRR
ncbi:membrane protein insertase YidC [Williamsia muralis]|uniref:Membrane protein insertase YidC n=1 Tax=Williamsia marianensis TaxID=85044 RepID=A0A315SCA3_WILMA|nr:MULTISPECIES: membrane protein insertase YidC [Williamsia]MDV7133523.1 membrane protein insertase YidC [Williamsia muralis]PVY30825.1 YidC/Oxa1 family membrane protein insertase [Williamsia marianensis]RKR97953.1 YidC/Oxa1 family membrane protein insertase [Williamsia muralis]